MKIKNKPKFNLGQSVYGFDDSICNPSTLIWGVVTSVLIEPLEDGYFDYYYIIGPFITHKIKEENIRLTFESAVILYKEENDWRDSDNEE